MSRNNSSRSISMIPGQVGQKSPNTQDRYMYKSPSRMNTYHENLTNDLDCYNYGMINGTGTPGTPGTPKSSKHPPTAKTVILDAPDIRKDPPVKLIDVNDRNELVVAIDTNVYIWKDNKYHLLMDGNVPIDGVCWVGNNVAISGDGHVELWDVNRQEAFQEFFDHDRRAAALSAYRDTAFATGGADGVVCIFDLRNSRNSRKYNAHRGQVCTLSWAPDGLTLASGGDDCNVSVFEPRQKYPGHIKHTAPVHSLAWMKPGLLVTGQSNDQGEIKMFNLKTGEQKSETTGASISGICMTEKWGLLVSHDDHSGIWEIWTHDLSRKYAEYKNHDDQIINISSNSEGSYVVTISGDEHLAFTELQKAVLTPVQQSRGYSYQCKSPRSSLMNNGAMKSPMGLKSVSSYMPASPGGFSFGLR